MYSKVNQLCAWSVTQSCPIFCDSMSYSPWGFPGKNTGVGCHILLQGIFLTQGSNPHHLHLLQWQVYSLPLSHLGSPIGQICTYIHSFSIVFLYKSLQSIEEQFLCHIVGSRSLSSLFIVVYVCQSQSPHLSLSPLSLVTISLFPISVTLFLFYK